MKEHFCSAEKSMITYEGSCNWCGESEGSMTQEALKLALEALEDFVDVIKYDNEQDDIGRRACCDVLSYNPHSESCKAKQAITAIKEAIREHAMYEVQRLGQEIEQEPVGFAGIEMWIGNTRIKKLMAQAELHYAIDPWAIVKFNSDSCIDALKEKNND
jgi:hypothetical protein